MTFDPQAGLTRYAQGDSLTGMAGSEQAQQRVRQGGFPGAYHFGGGLPKPASNRHMTSTVSTPKPGL